MDEIKTLDEDFVQLARLAVQASSEDVRLFLARLVRKYRSSAPARAEKIESYLKTSPARNGSPLRLAPDTPLAMPADAESRLSLLKVYDDSRGIEAPLLPPALSDRLELIVKERLNADRLRQNGISPTRSAVFVGKPGVGKTLTARWLAWRLKSPLWVLDLTSVMSSLLGKTGSNLRTVLDFAKTNQAVLLIDELDAIAKRRGDETDVGELKRLVTVMLQEVEAWPDTSLLLAATNHPELIDPALWRRFDAIVDFDGPSPSLVLAAVHRYLASDRPFFDHYVGVLAALFEGESFSYIERAVNDLRRARLLETDNVAALVERLVPVQSARLSRAKRVEVAVALTKISGLSQHEAHRVTGVSRDTIRKYSAKQSER